MGRLTKKLRKKTQAIEVVTKEPDKKSKRRDFWLFAFILFNLFILITNYQMMTIPMMTMYSLMVLSLAAILIKNRYTVSENVEKYLTLVGTSGMIFAMVLFAIVCYQQYFA